MKLGYTQLSIYHDCPRKFYFGQVLEYQPLEVPAPMECGLFVHSAIESSLNGKDYMNAIEQSLSDTLQKLNNIEDKAKQAKAQSTSVDNANRAKSLAKRYCEFYLKDYEPIAIEQAYTLNNVVCHIDLVAEYKGKLTIVDFKTSRSPDVRWYIHSGQTDLYAYVWDNAHKSGMPALRITDYIKSIELAIYDVISDDNIFRIEHKPNENKGKDIYNDIMFLSVKFNNIGNYPAHWHYDCPSRCAYYNPCCMLEDDNLDGCMELLDKNYEKRYFRDKVK
jgi:hypothetical protein